MAIVQARTGSSRLPGKVLRPILGVPMLSRVVERLRRATTLTDIMVATTVLANDDPVAEVTRRLGVSVFRGDEQDVLGRYVLAAQATQAEVVVRVTSDCPLLDAGVLDEAVTRYLAAPGALDYVSNTRERTYPRGLDVEVLPRGVLEAVHEAARAPEEREHVTLHLLRRPDRYRIAQLYAPADYSRHSWTVDTEEELRLIERIYQALSPGPPDFTWRDVLAILDEHPELAAISRAQAARHDARLRSLLQS